MKILFQDLQQGSNVTLSCKTDDYWEYCDWKHKSRDCKFEWKYSKVGKYSRMYKLENKPRNLLPFVLIDVKWIFWNGIVVVQKQICILSE